MKHGLSNFLLITCGILVGTGLAAGQAGRSDADDSVDVMKPTTNGFRLTPEFAEIISRRWLQVELGKDVTLNERQEAELSRRMADRLMNVADGHGEGIRDMVEYGIESLMESRGERPPPETRQEFGRRASDLMPVLRDLMKDFARDARPLLSDQQWEQLKNRLRSDFRGVDRVEKMLNRWADGEIDPDDDLEEAFEGDDAHKGETGKGGQKPRGNRMAARRARRMAEGDLRRFNPTTWETFLNSCAASFKFTDEQKAEGKALLARHGDRAIALMTPEWREQLRQNRIKYYMRWSLGLENIAPWVYHLDRQWSELTAPVLAIQNEFRDACVALATDEQRRAAIAQLRPRAESHGMVLDRADEDILLGLTR